ncbi:MAG: acetyl-CoA carboxylase biotin carboxyl carrier protein subunit [Prevotellaceae bacterium]|nr:acetyl-CoA carboxylase biotin carboxyl carrier protein subunit [Prevotellaceae bacterium]
MKKFSFEINGGNYEVNVISNEGGFAQVEVNGTPYNVKINGIEGSVPVAAAPVAQPAPVAAPAPAPVAAPAQPAAPVGKGSKSIKAPLPGSVLKVNIEAGTSFKEGDVLCVMESMKMENNITAENSGTVTKVCAPAGTAVLQDEVLFEYE